MGSKRKRPLSSFDTGNEPSNPASGAALAAGAVQGLANALERKERKSNPARKGEKELSNGCHILAEIGQQEVHPVVFAPNSCRKTTVVDHHDFTSNGAGS